MSKTADQRAPIALFLFRRPEHTRRTLTALRANDLAEGSTLYIFCDAARSVAEESAVREVRGIAENADGFASIQVILRDTNLGLATSIKTGVDYVLRQHGRVIVVEDDLVTSQHFLTYMNDGLNIYNDDARVASIHGYVYPVVGKLPETFFLRGSDCWGWGTWSRAWSYFDPDAAGLLAQLESRNLLSVFDFDGRFSYSEMLRQYIRGENDSWAIRWHASCFLAGLLTLYPGQSLVQNIGIDDTGTHCAPSDAYEIVLAARAPHVGGIEVQENLNARNEFGNYLQALTDPVDAFSEPIKPRHRTMFGRTTRYVRYLLGRA